MRHGDQATEESNPNANWQAINGQHPKEWQMRAGVLHDPRTHEPGPEQEHAREDYSEAEIIRGFFREPAASQFDRLPVAAAGHNASFLLVFRFGFGEPFLPFSLAFRGALLA